VGEGILLAMKLGETTKAIQFEDKRTHLVIGLIATTRGIPFVVEQILSAIPLADKVPKKTLRERAPQAKRSAPTVRNRQC